MGQLLTQFLDILDPTVHATTLWVWSPGPYQSVFEQDIRPLFAPDAASSVGEQEVVVKSFECLAGGKKCDTPYMRCVHFCLHVSLMSRVAFLCGRLDTRLTITVEDLSGILCCLCADVTNNDCACLETRKKKNRDCSSYINGMLNSFFKRFLWMLLICSAAVGISTFWLQNLQTSWTVMCGSVWERERESDLLSLRLQKKLGLSDIQTGVGGRTKANTVLI